MGDEQSSKTVRVYSIGTRAAATARMVTEPGALYAGDAYQTHPPRGGFLPSNPHHHSMLRIVCLVLGLTWCLLRASSIAADEESDQISVGQVKYATTDWPLWRGPN